jgi:hypothetical protein
MKRRPLVLVATVAAMTVGLVPASAAAAPSPEKKIVTEHEPTVAEELARLQEPLVAAATAITRLDPSKDALAGIRLQVREGAVEVYWKGEVPDSVREEIAAQEEAGVRLTVAPADYSGGELDAALKQIADGRDRYPGLVLLAPSPEGNGLEGYFTDPDAARKYDFPLPVRIERAEGISEASRSSDTPPFWGGAAARVGGAGCTTGFAAAQTIFGVQISRGVLSAAHCDPGGGNLWTTPPGRTIGVSGGPVGISDSIYIRTSSAGRTYTGPVGSSTSKQVVGPTPNFPGQFVCTEGAATGEHCLVMNQIVGGVAFIGGSVRFGVTVAMQIAGGIAVGQGDSGGPVVASLGPTAELAAGLISFLVFGTPCSSGSTALCSAMVGYIDINWVLATNFPMVLLP